MKNFIFLLIVIMVTIQCSAQSKIVNLTDRDGIREADTYYKDVDYNLDAFVGTWVYTDGNTSLKIILKKEIKHFEGKYYEDLLIGEYQYIENGVEKINTIPQLNTILPDQRYHAIFGNNILKNESIPRCDDCLPNEKRLRLYFSDPIRELGGKLLIRQITVNGKQAWKAFRQTVYLPSLEGEPDIEMFVPDGEYILIKQ